MKTNKTLQEALTDYLPEGCAGIAMEWFGDHKVALRITRNRRSKLGDFRGGNPMVLPRISVNHNLNVYSFLITLIHEMAHAEVFLQGKRRTLPHGDQWKSAYQRLAVPYLKPGLMPGEISQAFTTYLSNPAASSTACIPLANALRKYDNNIDKTFISDLPEEALFALPDGRVFRRGTKLRKRYRCVCLNNKRIYLFSPMAEIIPVENEL
jgi:SprT protein